ncbi:alpha-ketoacid dehydrogenase subunit alpha/beta [Luteibaculum oceani]|uniref:Dehydrogenase n=1 Tax=Luteibaculum oceani TaxID=1294296 RepID=A0A5C6VA48_9FLAO|nr:dehydrogenase E1 component subunit alpha/beta [Luteibaculum oceani]TXC81361.1 dehydrogenase [Luteibaculum oceani]
MFVDNRPINAFSPLSVGKSGFSDKELLNLYKQLLLPRVIENKMLSALRGGKISKWFSGFGQETLSVCAAAAMHPDEYICTMHRNLGVFTTRKVPLNRLFAQFMGKAEGYTKGRDRSFHFGAPEHNLVGMISHLGPQLGVADGLALNHKLREDKKAVLAFTGDGATSEGDFHEAMNVAAVWDLPVLFVVENNYWGLSTPYYEQYKCKQFIDKAVGYGMEAVQLDGNNPTELKQKLSDIADYVRTTGKPLLAECVTFRMRGHEEASGTAYYPEGLGETWSKRDGVEALKELLLREGIAGLEELAAMEESYAKKVKTALDEALAYDEIIPDPEVEMRDVYTSNIELKEESPGEKIEMRMIDAIKDALDVALDSYPELVLMGQDIADYGGVFKATEGLAEKFGKERVRNTPLCESAILGTSLGFGIAGGRSMVEMQFADFVSCGMTQIANNLAKIHYRWGAEPKVVVRMPTGAGVGAGPFHSQSLEAWFTKIPGLKVYFPSNAYDAKGLLLRAIADNNPVLFFEHKYLYRTVKSQVPSGFYTVDEGKASIAIEGDALTIITYGLGVHWAMEVADSVDASIEVLDLRTLVPMDWDSIYASVNKCNKAIVLQEDTISYGVASEIVSKIQENCFFNLDAPVMKVGSLDTPVPFAKNLENQFLPKERLKLAVEKLLQL